MTLGEWCDENGDYGDKLLEEWYDPDRTVEEVTRGAKYKALWRCSAGCTKDGKAFTWEARVSNRTSSNRAGCPGCAGRNGSPTDQNNLQQWCQDNSEYGRKLIEEWAEPDLAIKDVTPASHKKLMWRCSAGCTKDGKAFTWEAAVGNRTSSRRVGCPGCAGQSPTDQNNLLQWCQDNGEYGRKLIEEWAEPDLAMKDVTPSSGSTGMKMSWRCSAGCTEDGEPFTWEAMVHNRTSSKHPGCPGCSGRSPTDQNNLLQWCQDNGEYGRKLIEEWAEPDLAMKDVMPATNKKLSWRCTVGCTEDGETFSWEATVNNRTRPEREGCPGCSPYAPISLQKRLGKVPR
ncbi:predicted protein [Micromonas commoda]|uniref:Treble clef zinc finger domain-containing protein n=1 Tax=Micromonas commoda (strain RCC299 / NOUM17 / CCMP2709) TaxID=296587 RepID=C1FIA8_MICCC|nr:predicted protein [Micromonas commoda]ACO69964.1 predicted protein [Micromonas commoda]|eukprot:XP_002508706.1 predicted protein [Micromonas commoda]